MNDFEAILNAEIVESGRVPNIKVVNRTKAIADILENYFSDRSTLTPVIGSAYDVITFTGSLNDSNGFNLYIGIKEEDKSVEEELVVWNKKENAYISIKGTLVADDFKYAFNRGGKI